MEYQNGISKARYELVVRTRKRNSWRRWVSSQPSSIGIVTKPRVTTKEKLNSGMMVVTRWTKCHGNDESFESSSVDMQCDVRSRV